MQLGWIDFSKQEREKVLDVIQLLKEQGAVDELGIGTIRDGFANYFFPGTSTIQTRAKYFLIVPYVLKEAGEGKYGTEINKALREIDNEERKCGLKLIQGNKDGVIGSMNLPRHWVARKPSDIYWYGIKRFGIFRNPELSIREYLSASLKLREMDSGIKLGNHNDEAENEHDDNDAGDFTYLKFWTLPDFNQNWRENLKIGLLPEEAAFLRKQITENLKGTLFAYLLENNIPVEEYEDFASLSEAVYEDVPEEMQQMMTLANAFNNLVYLARVRYNVMLSGGENEEANNEWNYYRKDLERMSEVDLESVRVNLHINNFRLMKFLKGIKAAFNAGDVAEADRLIRKQEVDLKGISRAKLNRVGEFPSDLWLGGGFLDYRFTVVKRLIRDIYKGEAEKHV
jgi:hypothetical protein